ncbi:unnamed protein product [Brachionus calyciflorus]|uniref:Uncharacterized protein n=1 Tax=Brachionus calyciflorus TaxID=104777 RepID=A0A814PJZ0_9BILA|nr:unnamed protein product [Brachionus calyciflorus]
MNPPLFRDQIFDNFDDFLQVFKDFSKESFTLWTTYSSAKRDDDQNLKYVHFKCVHYRKPDELTSKSAGIRPKQSYIAPLGCLAEIRVNYVISGNLKNKYQIVKCNLQHERLNSESNLKEKAHELSHDDFVKHPSNRRLNKEEEDEINNKFDTGSDAKLIAQFMSKKTGKWLTIRDIWNVRTKYLTNQKNQNCENYPLKQFEQAMIKQTYRNR